MVDLVVRSDLAQVPPYSEIYHQMRRSIEEIKSTYGDTVKLKHKSVRKFGRTANADSGIPTTIMTLPGATQRHETMATTNAIDSISSSDASDTEVLTLEGHTIDGNGLLTFVVQDVTLSGQTKVTLGTPLARCTRAYVKAGTFASPSGDLVGAVYVYEDGSITSGVPDTDEDVHLVIEAGKNQSEKCATSFSNVDYYAMTAFTAAVGRGNAGGTTVDFELEWRELGGVWRPIGMELSLRGGGSNAIHLLFATPIIFPPNSDLRMVATSNGSNVTCSGHFVGELLIRQV